MKSIIRQITHPEPAALWQARHDHAHITGQELVEPPWWYEDIETGETYHDIFGCIGWPSEASDKTLGLPGYAAIIGVKRPKGLDIKAHYDPRDAEFYLLAESQSLHVPVLLRDCLKMREKYGFGVQPELLSVWYGDPERFTTTLALFNERLGEQNAIVLGPPDDFYVPKIFDNYVRSLRSTIIKGEARFFVGACDILPTRAKEFRRDDPCVLAVGGLIHSLLNRCMWMSQVEGSTCFSVEEAV